MSHPIETPCVKVCLVKDNACVGCGRTLAEIAAWPRLSPQQRRAIMDMLGARIAAQAGRAEH